MEEKSRNSSLTDGLLFVNEDHFSINSELDSLDDIENKSILSREEQLEQSINKHITHLRTLSSSQASDQDLEDKKRSTVKKICELKVKLNKLREEAELEGVIRARKTSIRSDQLPPSEDSSPENVILHFQRAYNLTKHVGGHKLVPSNDVYENEKRFRSMCQSGSSTPSAGLSPTSSLASSLNSLSTGTLKLYQILSTTSSYISFLTSACTNWATNSTPQPTNPFASLVCDCCLKKSSKSLNSYFLEAFKFTRKADPGTDEDKTNDAASNPYLVCIYCFYTVHLKCLHHDVRKCPKLYFDCLDAAGIEALESCFYSNLTGNYTNETFKFDTIKPKKHKASMGRPKLNANEIRTSRVILKISPEVGLARQDFRCVECKIPLSPSPPKSNPSQNVSRPRLCDYFGLYFCENCHLGDTAIIPGRVIHNWDFQPRLVSRAALQIISYLRNTASHFDRPVLFNLVNLNPMLFGLIDELIHIKRLRNELSHIYKYISLCKQPNKPRLWLAIMCQVERHLLDEQQVNSLSFSDLCDLKTLHLNLAELESLFIQHITSCESCRGKGFYCELCPNKDDVLFPFSPNTTTCSLCYAVYHKNCYYRRNRMCPRCNRIKDKRDKLSMSSAHSLHSQS